MARSRFDAFTEDLGQETENAVITKSASEKELNATVAANLNQLKAFIDEGSVSGEDFKTIIDSAASISGKTLAEEKIGGPEGKTVKATLYELLEEEGAYEEGKWLLTKEAAKLKLSIDAYLEKCLADPTQKTFKKVVDLKDQAEKTAAELRVGIKAYAASLVDQLQANNTEKGTKADEELAEWKKTFSSVESVGAESHEDQIANIIAKFVERKSALTAHEDSSAIKEYKERIKTTKEVVWGNYAKAAQKFVEEQCTKEDKEHQRDLLRKLFNENAPAFQDDHFSNRPRILINESLEADLSKEVLRPLLLEFLRTSFLAKTDSSSTRTQMEALACARSGINDNPVSDEVLQQTAAQEIPFLNALDAVNRFSHPGSAEEAYRQFSPILITRNERGQIYNPPLPVFGLPITTEGVLYSPIDTKNRTSDVEATKAKEAFIQQLSDALNKGKLHEDRTSATAKDKRNEAELRVTAAEQRALIAEGAMNGLETQLATSKKEASDLLIKSNKLAGEKATLELRTKGLVETERKLTEAQKELTRIKAGLENAVATSGFMGTSKKVLQNLLTPPVQE